MRGMEGGHCSSGKLSFRRFSYIIQVKKKLKLSLKGKRKFPVSCFRELSGIITQIGQQKLGNIALERTLIFTRNIKELLEELTQVMSTWPT